MRTQGKPGLKSIAEESETGEVSIAIAGEPDGDAEWKKKQDIKAISYI